MILAGNGLVLLGGLVGIGIAALARHGWPVAVLIAAATFWMPLLSFWLATRLRLAPED
jgi:hypothetical protein